MKYFPIRIGNVWTYHYWESHYMGSSEGYDKYTITDSANINGKVYYNFEHIRRVLYGQYSCDIRVFNGSFRIDSTTCNIYLNQTCNGREYLVDSLRSGQNDSFSVCDMLSNRSACTDTSTLTIFGMQRRTKTFAIIVFEHGKRTRYVKDFGIDYYNTYGLIGIMSGCTNILQGCVINGTMYGDTSLLVGIRRISSNTPDKYNLYQNYPNPFNPGTKIKFDIPAVSAKLIASLRIYDMLGREVAMPVNEELKPGTYETEWDAANYPSGVYYYKLTAGDYSETKKMVLLK